MLLKTSPTWLPVLHWLAVLILIGEAAALLLGMTVFTKPHNPWFNIKNKVFLFSDILLGLILAFFLISGGGPAPLFYTVLILLIFSHGGRVLEPFFMIREPFTANTPLQVVNLVKLILFGLFFYY